MSTTTFTESLYPSYGQSYTVDKILFESKTEHQNLIIFENQRFGRVMALDGIVQTTELDEFIYHEMLTHVPLFSHPNPQKVLIIGGGDGGILREVLKHQSVQSVTQVEIDQAVIDLCTKYLPKHSDGAYEDPRANIVIDDGIRFIQQCKEKFDVIISDSTDPVGPGEVLFTSDFYKECQRCLTEQGLLVTQNGVAFMQIDEVITTNKRFSKLFSDHGFFCAAVPTYIGGVMTFGWASDNVHSRQFDLGELQARFVQSGIKTRYYNPQVHIGSFALPQYILNALENNTD